MPKSSPERAAHDPATAAIDFALRLHRSDEAQVFLAAYRAGDADALSGWSDWPAYFSEQQDGGSK